MNVFQTRTANTVVVGIAISCLICCGCSSTAPQGALAASGGADVAGKSAFQIYDVGKLQLVILFDKHDVARAPGISGGSGLRTTLPDGRVFDLRVPEDETSGDVPITEVTINGERFALAEGRLFLCFVGDEEFEVRQIPVQFPPQVFPPDDEPFEPGNFVENAVLEVSKSNLAVKRFLEADEQETEPAADAPVEQGAAQ